MNIFVKDPQFAPGMTVQVMDVDSAYNGECGTIQAIACTVNINITIDDEQITKSVWNYTVVLSTFGFPFIFEEERLKRVADYTIDPRNTQLTRAGYIKLAAMLYPDGVWVELPNKNKFLVVDGKERPFRLGSGFPTVTGAKLDAAYESGKVTFDTE